MTYLPPQYNMLLLRHIRNEKLRDTDVYMTISDWPISEERKAELITYRQELRNLPQKIINQEIEEPGLDENLNLVFDNWPTPPSWL